VSLTRELDRARAAGAIRDVDYFLARHLLAIAPRPSAELALAVAAVSRANADGDVCLHLPVVAGGLALRDAPEPAAWAGLPAPPLGEWTESLRASGIVGNPGDVEPLILDGAGRLYLAKYFGFEQAIAAGLLSQVGWNDGVDGARLAALLERYFPGTSRDDGQKLAAALAVLRRLTVIAGGPGTGKTHTVARILAILLELAGEAPLRIALAAPTGKAAARLAESLQRARVQPADDPAAVAGRLPAEAATLHRLLGYRRSGGFRHGAANPLALDVLVVDEASMIDVPLMARLLPAIPHRARLILLGDRDQLASVEAGSALGDLCSHGAPIAWSADLAGRLRGLGLAPPAAPVGAQVGPMGDSLAVLTESRRFRSGSGIGALARATNAGDTAAALDVLAAAGDVCWRELSREALTEAIAGEVVGALADYRRTVDPAEAMRRFNRVRILCAVRDGPWGVAAVNAEVERVLARLGLVAPHGANYAGRPVLVTQNDHRLDLYNGDVGLLLPDGDAAGALRAFFVQAGGRVRRVLPGRLPGHETCFAMTVHKAQGSEFDRVVVLLPDRDGPVLTRELVYTAVTRARESVELWAPREVLARAIGRRVQRSSGLREALWGAGAVGGG
jgi:exodeoxyribonuclease V alpha subunit